MRPLDSGKSDQVVDSFGLKLLCVPQLQQSFVCTQVHYIDKNIKLSCACQVKMIALTYHAARVENQIVRVLLRAEVQLGRDLQVEVVVNVASGDDMRGIASNYHSCRIFKPVPWHTIFFLRAVLSQTKVVVLQVRVDCVGAITFRRDCRIHLENFLRL